ncbi:unnamed protein product [Gulo gulo]|uniref:Uncharacterized protein n=1 Tax=Gulo gulo TaxID=48420 RepID=A0A9X9LPW9_GULGU|nr:unnamed protein product [Gulo gulo]
MTFPQASRPRERNPFLGMWNRPGIRKRCRSGTKGVWAAWGPVSTPFAKWGFP